MRLTLGATASTPEVEEGGGREEKEEDD